MEAYFDTVITGLERCFTLEYKTLIKLKFFHEIMKINSLSKLASTNSQGASAFFQARLATGRAQPRSVNGSHSFEGRILLLFKIIALIVFTTCKVLKLLSFKVGEWENLKWGPWCHAQVRGGGG